MIQVIHMIHENSYNIETKERSPSDLLLPWFDHELHQ